MGLCPGFVHTLSKVGCSRRPLVNAPCPGGRGGRLKGSLVEVFERKHFYKKISSSFRIPV